MSTMLSRPVDVTVEGHEVLGEPRPYAVYKLVVREEDEEWRLERRWNDLRLAVDQLQRECRKELNACSQAMPKFSAHGFRSTKAMLEPTFLDTRAASMQALLRAYLEILPTSLLREEGPIALRNFLGQSSPSTAGVYSTPSCTPLSTPRNTMSTVWPTTGSTRSTIAEETTAVDQTDLVHEACKKMLFEAGTEDGKDAAEESIAEQRSPVKGVPIAEGSAAPSWGYMAMLASVVIVPVLVIAAKELARLPSL